MNGNCCMPSRSGPRVSTVDESVGKTGSASGSQFIRLDDGSFLMGSEDSDSRPEDGEGPVRPVEVGRFEISPTTVTNKLFQSFIDDTGYVTTAEQYGWSFVFRPFVSQSKKRRSATEVSLAPWWLAVSKASWRKPEGLGSSLRDRMDHPVVHVSWHDANRFCEWANCRLPTEVEWEYAARGGLEAQRFPWGNQLTPDGVHQCNIWQGRFPSLNTCEDGFVGTAPVETYEPNGYGLFQMSGNVWEWTADAVNSGRYVLKGGSYLCHQSYCNRYRVAARYFNDAETSTGNCGFRCVSDG